MALFPELINGKMAALLTVHTDSPPSKICLALFDKEEDIWSEEYWIKWHADLASHIIPIPRGDRDHIELGSPPIKTEKDGCSSTRTSIIIFRRSHVRRSGNARRCE